MKSLFWRRKASLNISDEDPSFKSCYLGNILSCVAKPVDDEEICLNLSRLWKGYQARKKNSSMVLTVTNTGLKAKTTEFGVVDYWTRKITYCGVHRKFPKLVCWIYRHDGKNLRPELRFHAVEVSKSEKAQRLAFHLNERICLALKEFKREKLHKQQRRILHENILSKRVESKHDECEQPANTSGAGCSSQIETNVDLVIAASSGRSRIAAMPVMPKPKEMKSSGKNFRVPVCGSGAVKLCDIEEEDEHTDDDHNDARSTNSSSTDEQACESSTETSRDSAVVSGGSCSSSSNCSGSEKSSVIELIGEKDVIYGELQFYDNGHKKAVLSSDSSITSRDSLSPSSERKEFESNDQYDLEEDVSLDSALFQDDDEALRNDAADTLYSCVSPLPEDDAALMRGLACANKSDDFVQHKYYVRDEFFSVNEFSVGSKL